MILYYYTLFPLTARELVEQLLLMGKRNRLGECKSSCDGPQLMSRLKIDRLTAAVFTESRLSPLLSFSEY